MINIGRYICILLLFVLGMLYERHQMDFLSALVNAQMDAFIISHFFMNQDDN